VDERQIQHFVRKLQAGETTFWILNVILFALGAVFSLLGPLVVASLIQTIAHRLNLKMPFSGWALFLLVSLLVLPAIYWWEWRTKGSYVQQAIEENREWFHGRASSYGEWATRWSIGEMILRAEFILWAPRQVFAALQRSRQRLQLKQVSMFRAAEILCELKQRDGSVEIRQLVRHDETLHQLHDILGYLSLLDWIDISKDAKRTWMLGHARKR
jgi:hypothetical protein